MDLKLSVLDLSPISSSSTGAQALRNTLDLAQLTDRLGYVRYWLAEHHNAPSLASSAPEVLIGQVADVTEHLRIGAGGIMLLNHAPLKVVETFRVLEALHPGRIDLGIGRAPGTDPVTAAALRRSHRDVGTEGFPQQFLELLSFARGGFPEDHPFRSVSAMPSEVELPPIWLLGSSGTSAKMAAEWGFGYAFASQSNPSDPTPAISTYRENFEPSKAFDRPSAILAASVICGETDDHAEELASSMALAWIRMLDGDHEPLPSTEEAISYQYTPDQIQKIDAFRSLHVVGSSDAVQTRLVELANRTAADEIMVMTTVHDHEERRRSYMRLAEAFQIVAPNGNATSVRQAM